MKIYSLITIVLVHLSGAASIVLDFKCGDQTAQVSSAITCGARGEDLVQQFCGGRLENQNDCALAWNHRNQNGLCYTKREACNAKPVCNCDGTRTVSERPEQKGWRDYNCMDKTDLVGLFCDNPFSGLGKSACKRARKVSGDRGCYRCSQFCLATEKGPLAHVSITKETEFIREFNDMVINTLGVCGTETVEKERMEIALARNPHVSQEGSSSDVLAPTRCMNLAEFNRRHCYGSEPRIEECEMVARYAYSPESGDVCYQCPRRCSGNDYACKNLFKIVPVIEGVKLSHAGPECYEKKDFYYSYCTFFKAEERPAVCQDIFRDFSGFSQVCVSNEGSFYTR